MILQVALPGEVSVDFRNIQAFFVFPIEMEEYTVSERPYGPRRRLRARLWRELA